MMPLMGAGPAAKPAPVGGAMEFIIVRYVRKRKVFIDGEETGTTGERLRVEEGTHTINLGDPRDYAPKWRRPTVTGTTSIKPMEIAFEEA